VAILNQAEESEEYWEAELELPATFDSSVSATQLVHKRFGDLRVPQPCL